MERLDDAVRRILALKEKLGLFHKDRRRFRELSESEKEFIRETQKKTAEKSITLIRDTQNLFPIDPCKTKKILLIPVINHEPSFSVAEHLRDKIAERGIEVLFRPKIEGKEFYCLADEVDLIIFAMFSRSFRPIGFLDYYGSAASALQMALNAGRKKTIGVSFGSPYFFKQYFERACTFVNAYSMLDIAVDAFVEAAFGEKEFNQFSPVTL